MDKGSFRLTHSLSRVPFFYWGFLLALAGVSTYAVAAVFGLVCLIFQLGDFAREGARAIVWYSSVPTALGLVLIAVDLGLVLPAKRRAPRWLDDDSFQVKGITVALTAYNDEDSIALAVKDFARQPLVRRVIVVSNDSKDATMARAANAGALVFNEPLPGYGSCVYRCFQEALQFDDAECVVLCEGDRTFRAADIDKLLSYIPHAEIVNGTRIVEQLRAYKTQLSTFMYYGNFFAGKLLEFKHLGRGTLTDVGTTYKAVRRDALRRLMDHLDPRVNLEFNAHFLDTAFKHGFLLVECPITFHARVGVSKGGNVNNLRALAVGLRMLSGISFGWWTVRTNVGRGTGLSVRAL